MINLSKNKNEKMKNINYQDLTPVQKNLLAEAEKVMKNAYNPYSHFSVGAALLTFDEEIITGANYESASYGGLTICAERAALARANAMGKRALKALAIIGKGENFDTAEVSAPCGSCRQMLYEASQIAEKDMEIILSTTKKDKIVLCTINELLPLGFGPKDLGVDVKKYQ
ncbi:MAG: cytidine deaminase [Patescibacteria group bacterium]